ncbi:MAG: hypothetical protein BZY77_04860 [SAR202 cluster bacterium Io17-Chloro-G5]|nr:MAG: hypothetical protein BZY77_04860 [SAR202 cluster bacterium Io17-Chloro-G5]
MGISRSIKRTTLAAGLLLMILAIACGGDRDSDGNGSAVSLVPQRANVVGSVAATQALEAFDFGVDELVEMLSSGSSEDDDGIGKFFKIEQFQTGGLFEDISRADFFGEITDNDDVEYFAILLHGSFDEASLITGLESVSGEDLVQQVYKGSNVYYPAGDAGEFALSVLDTSTFAVGTGGAINDTIDITVGDADPASNSLIDALNDLYSGIFGFALKVPADLAEDAGLGSISQLGDLPIPLDFISALDIVGLGGDLDGDSLNLKVTMEFNDEDAAESLEGFIDGIAALASGFLPDPDTAGLLEGLIIDRDGSRLTIEIAVPVSDIPDLFSDLTSPASIETFGGTPPGTPEIRVISTAIGRPVQILQSVSHVPEGQKVGYSDAPPTSGEHWSKPASCGFYTEDLPDERIVHNLEHGNIVVSYNFTNPAQVTGLRDALEDIELFDDWGVARPYDRIADGQVAIAAWGHLHTMNGVSPGELALFFEALSGVNGPERFTC